MQNLVTALFRRGAPCRDVRSMPPDVNSIFPDLHMDLLKIFSVW